MTIINKASEIYFLQLKSIFSQYSIKEKNSYAKFNIELLRNTVEPHYIMPQNTAESDILQAVSYTPLF